MAAAFALAIFSERIVIIFVVQNRLQAVLNHFFAGKGCCGAMQFAVATFPCEKREPESPQTFRLSEFYTENSVFLCAERIPNRLRQCALV